jgi:hypothetical protein
MELLIAQLEERATVVFIDIVRSLVRIQLRRMPILLESFLKVFKTFIKMIVILYQ